MAFTPGNHGSRASLPCVAGKTWGRVTGEEEPGRDVQGSFKPPLTQKLKWRWFWPLCGGEYWFVPVVSCSGDWVPEECNRILQSLQGCSLRSEWLSGSKQAPPSSSYHGNCHFPHWTNDFYRRYVIGAGFCKFYIAWYNIVQLLNKYSRCSLLSTHFEIWAFYILSQRSEN